MEWISVKDRLPSKRGEYLCWRPDILDGDELAIPACPIVLTFTGRRFITSFAVTHWAKIDPPVL